jgi:hypothetical protein
MQTLMSLEENSPGPIDPDKTAGPQEEEPGPIEE